jgi:hypothetical protein
MGGSEGKNLDPIDVMLKLEAACRIERAIILHHNAQIGAEAKD